MCDPGQIAVVRNGLDEAPPRTLTVPRSATPRVAVLSRLVPHKQIEDALEADRRAARRAIPGLHLDIVGGGWWQQRLVDHAELLGISDAVTFHGHVDDVTKHHVLQRSWVHVLPSRKEGWGLAVIEAAQHSRAHDRLPVLGRADGFDRRRGHRNAGRRPRRTGRRARRLLADAVLREQLGAKAQAAQRRILLAAKR